MSNAPESDSRMSPSWRESAVEFVSARMELLAIEAREAGLMAAQRGVLAAVIAGCAMTAWLAGVAGLIGWIAASATVSWYFAALGAAVFHLLIAGIVVFTLRRKKLTAFPLSKAELLKDREWLLNLKDRPKS